MITLTAEQAQQIDEIVEHLLVDHPTARHHKACVEALSIIRAARAQELNLNCKSVQKRLATSWGYVKAEQAEQEPVVWYCPDCGTLSELQAKCCPDWIRSRKVPKNFALTCKATFDRNGQAEQEPLMDYERINALREGEQNGAEDAYFFVRPENDTPTLRKMFCQGFERGFHKGLKYAAPIRTKGLGETMAEYLGERLHRDSFVRRAVSLPEPMEYPPVYPDESRQEQSTAYQYRKGWNDCLARCKQSNLSMQEQAGIKEWEKLKNPQTLFVNLNCGFPAQLERDHLVHLLNKVDPLEPGPVAEVVYQTATDSYGTSRLDSKTIVPYKPISELAVGTKLYRYPVRTKDLTDDEIRIAIGDCELWPYEKNIARAVIAADREKNRA